MNIQLIIYVSIIALLLSILWLIFSVRKNSTNLKEKISNLHKDSGSGLETINENVLEISELLETYKKVVEEKNNELKKYKEGGDLQKQKNLFVSLIEILEFINEFKKNLNNLDEKTKNYVEAIYDKLEIILMNSGVEKFSPEINQNVLEINGCSPSIETKKTKEKNKVNHISSVIKPGYRLQIKENDFIILKNSEVQVYELDV